MKFNLKKLLQKCSSPTFILVIGLKVAEKMEVKDKYLKIVLNRAWYVFQ